ncbi:extensin-like [Homalodisca vitripennis]|uniref:extensin-like n=1 Tax=Homalodisca vitripennis TaxID=197043 RepID=UPI001EEC6DE6|nr:extensin-like [Homalodisca vitripennis]
MRDRTIEKSNTTHSRNINNNQPRKQAQKPQEKNIRNPKKTEPTTTPSSHTPPPLSAEAYTRPHHLPYLPQSVPRTRAAPPPNAAPHTLRPPISSASLPRPPPPTLPPSPYVPSHRTPPRPPPHLQPPHPLPPPPSPTATPPPPHRPSPRTYPPLPLHPIPHLI